MLFKLISSIVSWGYKYLPISDVFLLVKTNSNVSASIGGTTGNTRRLYVVVESGTDPNCISRTLLSSGPEKYLLPTPLINLRGAGCDAKEISSRIHLTVRLNDTVVEAPFI